MRRPGAGGGEMNPLHHVKEYNTPERRPFSDSVDRAETHRRDLALLRVIGIIATMAFFGALTAATIYGWAAT